MAKTGPKPKPTVKKILQGNPGRRPLPKNEAQPAKTKGIPCPPRYLDKIAKREWQRMAKELHPIGLLTKVDLTALGAYCIEYSKWIHANAEIQKSGYTVTAQSGFPVISPYVTISNKAQAEMRKWLAEFGGTPSSRSRVAANPVKPESALEKFQKKGRKLEAVK